jgi:hypothetical protein
VLYQIYGTYLAVEQCGRISPGEDRVDLKAAGKGGKALAAARTPEERSEAARRARQCQVSEFRASRA